VYFNGDQSQRSVPHNQAALVPQRVKQLRDGRRVVMAERVHDFLAWYFNHSHSRAQQFFEISICSLGDQSYVDMVVSILDPIRSTNPAQSTIKGMCYSARGEYLHLMQSNSPRTPPKSVQSLFPWTATAGSEKRIRLDPLIGLQVV
jgi:hypothetical protein